MNHQPDTTFSEVSMADAAQLRELACAATLSVRDQLVQAFRSEMDVEFKIDRHDIVTVHDRAAEDRISEYLLQHEPGTEIVGEETGSRGHGKLCWFVDPIDGTANFACGLPSWCVSVGAVAEGKIVAGAILDPIGGNLFSADLSGAYLGNAPMRLGSVVMEAHANLITGYPSPRDLRQDGRDAALDRFGRLVETFSAVRRNGSAALGIAHVAAGWTDAAMGFGVSPWDVTAAILILRQSGGIYEPHFFGADVGDREDHLAGGYVATGAGADYSTLFAVAADIAASRTKDGAV